MSARTETRNNASSRDSVSRRELLRRVALGLGAVALAGARPAFAETLTPSDSVSTSRWTAPTLVRQGVGTVTVYSVLNESTNNAFVEAFKMATPGASVDILPFNGAGAGQTRIRTEKDSPKGDVFIGGSSEFHDPLGTEGLLESYVSPNAATVDAAYKDPAGNWTGWYLGIFGLIVNKDRWATEMASAAKPATWDDLLDPAYAGKLDMPSPVTTGGGYIFLATQVFRFNNDEERAMQYMTQLHANIGQYVGGSPQAIELVSQGQFLMGPNWGHDILTAAKNGAPIEFIAPAQTANEIGAVSIIKGGPNTEGAKAFVDWSLTKSAAELNVSLSNRLSVFPDIAPAPGAPTLDQVTLVPYDRAWATTNKDRLIKTWQSLVGL